MRNMSFFYTQDQIRDESKTETTRKGWGFLKIGDLVMACEKCQGLGKGGKIQRIKPIIIKKVEKITIQVKNYSKQNCINEGFPELTPEQFILDILVLSCGLKYYEPVNRITFEYIKEV